MPLAQYQGLPPGARGYMIGEGQAQEAGQRNLANLTKATQLQGALQKMQMEQQMKAELAAADTPEKQAAVAMKYGGPQAIMSHLDRKAQAEGRSADRKMQIDAQLKMASDKLEAGIAAARQRGEDQRTLMQMQLDGRRQMAQLAAGLRQAPAPSIVEIADPNDPTKAIKIDSRTREVIGVSPPKPKVERALPSPLQKQLTEAAELSDATQRFSTSFKDDFAGKTLTGELGNTYGRIMGDDTGQSQWWQDYELHQSQVRNKLFGSALTAPEIEAWNKSAINPRMDSAQVRANLQRRNTLESRGLERLMKGATAGGYNREQIEAFTGRSATPRGTPLAPAAPAAPTVSNW